MTTLVELLVLVADPAVGTAEEHAAVVVAALNACANIPHDLGADCAPALVAVAARETGMRPKVDRRFGCGAWSVLPNQRTSRGRTPPCVALEDPDTGARAALAMLDALHARGQQRWGWTFRAYNGTPQAASYARRVFRTFHRLRVALAHWLHRMTRLADAK